MVETRRQSATFYHFTLATGALCGTHLLCVQQMLNPVFNYVYGPSINTIYNFTILNPKIRDKMITIMKIEPGITQLNMMYKER